VWFPTPKWDLTTKSSTNFPDKEDARSPVVIAVTNSDARGRFALESARRDKYLEVFEEADQGNLEAWRGGCTARPGRWHVIRVRLFYSPACFHPSTVGHIFEPRMRERQIRFRFPVRFHFSVAFFPCRPLAGGRLELRCGCLAGFMHQWVVSGAWVGSAESTHALARKRCVEVPFPNSVYRAG
jgi:hypothetical protein